MLLFSWGPPFPERREDDLFRRLWERYPRKVAKLDAQKAFTKLKPTEALLQQMLTALAWQCESRDWLKDEGRYVPHLATWIRGGRYLDEPPASKAVAGSWECPHTPKCHAQYWCVQFRDARDAMRT
jgi:hypothetical protein